MDDSKLRYDVFVSYSHSDGRRVARWLQGKIARYRPPVPTIRHRAREYERELAGRTPEVVQAHLQDLQRRRHVFRDETDLSANPDLWEAIREKLLSSRFLVLVATPRSAGSKWIRQEVEEFQRIRAKNTLTALAAGTPETSFPQPLMEGLSQGHEPLYADFRGVPPWWALWKWPEYAARRRDSLLKILAPIWSIELADLRRDDAILQSARLRRWITALAISLAIMMLFLPPIQRALEHSLTRFLNRHIEIARVGDPPRTVRTDGRDIKGLLAYSFQYHEWSHPLVERVVLPELVALPAATFRMGGDAATSPGGPVVVSILPFAIGRYEVTNAQYLSFCRPQSRNCPVEPAPGYYEKDDAPAVFVSWDEAREYLMWLTDLTGIKYRLPSEAEWEYAARAGSGLTWGFGDSPAGLSEYAHFGHPSDEKKIEENHAEAVGQLKANAWGLHDMQGNVWEMTNSMCLDAERDGLQMPRRPPVCASQRVIPCKYPYSPSPAVEMHGLKYRIMRGGSWYANECAASLGVYSRLRWHPGKRDGTVGFRAAASLS